MNWFIQALKKYAVFSGRARRKEYWFFVLFYIIIAIVLVMIDSMAGTISATTGMGLLSGIFALAMFIPGLAVGIRRLHDINKSGWWILIGLIPFIGPLILIIFALMAGTAGDNEYGADPKAGAA